MNTRLGFSKYALKDTVTGKFFSKKRANGLNWSWTDRPEDIHLFSTKSIAERAVDGSTNSVVEVSVNYHVYDVQPPTSTRELVHLANQNELHTLEPQFRMLMNKPRLTVEEDNLYGRLKKRLRKLGSDLV